MESTAYLKADFSFVSAKCAFATRYRAPQYYPFGIQHLRVHSPSRRAQDRAPVLTIWDSASSSSLPVSTGPGSRSSINHLGFSIIEFTPRLNGPRIALSINRLIQHLEVHSSASGPGSLPSSINRLGFSIFSGLPVSISPGSCLPVLTIWDLASSSLALSGPRTAAVLTVGVQHLRVPPPSTNLWTPDPSSITIWDSVISDSARLNGPRIALQYNICIMILVLRA
ncbi:hypothetical protein AVEN_60307-1 [Araneus ventricosus]|uniref:Uncharacterized protein n=1 Tax=Araneus ventricosus TaxID=182803 RepID=A0A4Y2GS12_ARAVE|nr:hypothetical protein AVEN_60307-1 [Araneus ventricosus]